MEPTTHFELIGGPPPPRPLGSRSALALLLVVASVAATVRWAPAQVSSHTMLAAGLAKMPSTWSAPPAVKRCEWVVDQTVAHNAGKSYEGLRKQYSKQASDVNTFYRGTAYLFWHDFVRGGWGLFDLSLLGVPTTQADGTPLQRTSTWTWITGDQHLSNFGAWKNRNDQIIFGVNDFDESTIFDFQIDVWRCAVSIYDHAMSNGLDAAKATAAVLTFTDAYLSTLQGYVGNEKALLFEMTQDQATGKLADFLGNVAQVDSTHRMLDKYTEIDASGERRLLKNHHTRLEQLPAEVDAALRAAFRRETYGATLTKVGWHSHEWKESHFRVLDVAARLGSGVGSYGVGRYYVLLAGAAAPVILDVKFEPQPAVSAVLDRYDKAWYETLFANEAQRAIEGQRHLTSYTDPFTGWIVFNGSAHVVRQRSPWKAGFGLEALSSYADLAEFVQQLAVITATSHARGTVGKSPGQFKEVVSAALSAPFTRATWGVAVSSVAAAYREQVLFDYECFAEFVATNYSASSDDDAVSGSYGGDD